MNKGELLSDLVKAIDYDIWKSMFVPECIEEPEENEARIAELETIINKHIK